MRRNFDEEIKKIIGEVSLVSIQSFGEKEFRFSSVDVDRAGNTVSIQSFGEKEFRYLASALVVNNVQFQFSPSVRRNFDVGGGGG